MTQVQLEGIGVSLLVDVSLKSSTIQMPSQNEAIKGIGVSLVSAGAISSSAFVFDFSKATTSMYVPLLGGFV